MAEAIAIGADAEILDVAPLTGGQWAIGGQFRKFAGFPRYHFAVLDSSGQLTTQVEIESFAASPGEESREGENEIGESQWPNFLTGADCLNGSVGTAAWIARSSAARLSGRPSSRFSRRVSLKRCGTWGV